MKNIVEINSYNIGSTGRIMKQLKLAAEESGFCVYCCVPSERINKKNSIKNQLFIGTIIERQFHIKIGTWLGINEQLSVFSTFRFIQKLKQLQPKLIHLHNLHNCYINLPMLFRYIRKNNIPIVWTLHDCWAFTGRCPHFLITGCNRWKSTCGHCKYEKKEYPYAHVDSSKRSLRLKKKCYENIDKVKIIAPSYWMKRMVNESILSEYDVEVINNGIDLSVFKPRQSNFRKKHGIDDDCTMLLGVSFDWNDKKGLNDFIKLACELPPFYVTVLVGINKKTSNELPNNIIPIERTENQEELAEIYTAADIFVNPTKEDTFSLVNIEALACGTPVITYKSGGAAESIVEGCGLVINSGEYADLKDGILGFDLMRKNSIEDLCINQAKNYDSKKIYKKYIEVYKEMIKDE